MTKDEIRQLVERKTGIRWDRIQRPKTNIERHCRRASLWLYFEILRPNKEELMKEFCFEAKQSINRILRPRVLSEEEYNFRRSLWKAAEDTSSENQRLAG